MPFSNQDSDSALLRGLSYFLVLFCLFGDSAIHAMCEQDADCDHGEICEAGSCEANTCQNASTCHAPGDRHVICAETDRVPTQCKACVDDRCSLNCTTDGACDDGNPCTDDTCFPNAGGCAYEQKPFGTDLGGSFCDENAREVNCLRNDQCDDENPCTLDICAGGACRFEAIVCSGTERCVDGECVECSTDSDCVDDNDCTIDRCVSGGCTYTQKDNFDFCTGPGAGAGGLGQCKDGVCVDCLNGSGCPSDYTCENEVCLGCVFNSDCDDLNACTTEQCDDRQCIYTEPECADNEFCQEGACLECVFDSQCGDEDPCTRDRCDDGQCIHEAVTCAGNLICVDGSCVQCELDSTCDDRNPCTADRCVDGACTSTNMECDAGTFCADGRCVSCVADAQCAAEERCSNGRCIFVPCDGGCGIRETCDGQKCVCETGYKDCGAGCVNIRSDESHCGGCGFICSPGAACINGTCFIENTEPVVSADGGVNEPEIVGCGGCQHSPLSPIMLLFGLGFACVRKRRIC